MYNKENKSEKQINEIGGMICLLLYLLSLSGYHLLRKKLVINNTETNVDEEVTKLIGQRTDLDIRIQTKSIKDKEGLKMGGLLIVIGLGWLLYQIVKDETTKPVPPNTDYRQAIIDRYKYNLSGKEMDKRLTNGYYVKKDE